MQHWNDRRGTRANVISATAAADLQLRLVTPVAPVKEMLEQAVGDRARVRYLSEAEPQQMLGVDGFDTCVVRFTTDIPYLTNWGKPLLFGPGSILDAHTDHERIAKRELESCGSICEAGTHAGGIDFLFSTG